MAGYRHPAALERETAEREERINARLQIANRTEAMRNALAESITLPEDDQRVQAAVAALEAIVAGTPYPDWLIRTIRPDLRGEL